MVSPVAIKVNFEASVEGLGSLEGRWGGRVRRIPALVFWMRKGFKS